MLTIVRYSYSDIETLGHLFVGNEYFCDTLELPWKSNEAFISCIPEGSYTVEYRKSDRLHVKEGYLLASVPNREGILIHSANSVDELLGCIALGVKALSLVYNSRQTLYKLLETVGESETLVIERIEQ